MKTKLATLTFLVTFDLANCEQLGKVKEVKRLLDLSATNHDDCVIIPDLSKCPDSFNM